MLQYTCTNCNQEQDTAWVEESHYLGEKQYSDFFCPDCMEKLDPDIVEEHKMWLRL